MWFSLAWVVALGFLGISDPIEKPVSINKRKHRSVSRSQNSQNQKNDYPVEGRHLNDRNDRRMIQFHSDFTFYGNVALNETTRGIIHENSGASVQSEL